MPGRTRSPRCSSSTKIAAELPTEVGAAGSWALSPADQGSSATPPRNAVRLRDRPELRVDSARLIDTGAIDADSLSSWSAELAGNWRNFYLQGEKFWFAIDRRPASRWNPATGAWISRLTTAVDTRSTSGPGSVTT